MKKCSKCKLDKIITDFCQRKKVKDGLSSWCKSCRNLSAKTWQLNNAESFHQYKQEWYDDNSDKISLQKKQYYLNNQEAISKKHKQYAKDHKTETGEHRNHRYSTDINFRIACILDLDYIK